MKEILIAVNAVRHWIGAIEMASRNILHRTKLKEFEEYAHSKGYETKPVKGYFEVLRLTKSKDTIIIFQRLDGDNRPHLTVQDKDIRFVREFIRQKKEGQ